MGWEEGPGPAPLLPCPRLCPGPVAPQAARLRGELALGVGLRVPRAGTGCGVEPRLPSQARTPGRGGTPAVSIEQVGSSESALPTVPRHPASLRPRGASQRNRVKQPGGRGRTPFLVDPGTARPARGPDGGERVQGWLRPRPRRRAVHTAVQGSTRSSLAPSEAGGRRGPRGRRQGVGHGAGSSRRLQGCPAFAPPGGRAVLGMWPCGADLRFCGRAP